MRGINYRAAVIYYDLSRKGGGTETVMKKSEIKIISAVTAVILAASAVAPVSAKNAAAVGAADNGGGASAVGAEVISGGGKYAAAPQKEETVYVLADAGGEVGKIIVSEWLKNPTGADKLADFSALDGVENVKGDESYTMDENGMRVWDAGKNDIYYRGTTQKKLPVRLSVSYSLDGEPISADKLAGKSGRVKIRFDYENTEKRTVSVDGEKRAVYVPFAMLTGMTLDNDRFKNIEVSNGKLVNDGDKSAVVGFALPGLQENLGIKDKDFSIPQSVEISADVTDFSLVTTLTVATNGIFSDIDLNKLDDLDDLSKAADKLSVNFKRLVDGSSQLYDGVNMLLEKSDRLIFGIDKLANGAKKLNKGAKKLGKGSSRLYEGITALNSGLKQLDSKGGELCGGAKTVFDTLLSAAQTQIEASGLKIDKLTVKNYKSELNKALKSLDGETVKKLAYSAALQKVTETVNQNDAAIRSQVTEAVKAEVLKAVLAAAGINMTPEQYEQAAADGLISEQVSAAVLRGVSEQMASEAISSQINLKTEALKQQLIADSMKSKEVSDGVDEAVNSAAEGRKSISALIKQLDSYKTFYNGVIEYTGGVSHAYNSVNRQLKGGAKELSDGIGALASGTKTLSGGLYKLGGKSLRLVDGISQLKSGAVTLSKGMKEFNDKGISKLANMADGEAKEIVVGVKATVKAAKAYGSFAGKCDKTECRVNFIYRTDSIG